ncbi:hypothetical protein C0389_10035 [bacterium]|nr:hypothetical protein [bacterium]
MKPFFKAATLLSLVTILISCNTTEPIPVNENIKITEIDAAVIEAYLNIHVESPSPDKEVVLERNGQIVMRFSANKADTAITDAGLTENTLYRYKAKLREKGNVIGESSEISVRTILPTSHEFTWQTFTFGEHSSSSLYDVAIINENNIWAVGEIYMKDSTGQIDPQLYNLVKWDGNRWNTQRIFFTNQQGQSFLAPIMSIFAFNSDDIWLGMDQMIHWDGNDFKEYEISSTVFQSWINKIWGTSSSDLYIVGNNGNIAYYNGTSWQKIDSGIDWDVYDICGYFNSVNLNQEIICASTDPNNYSNSTILKITNKTSVSRIDLPTGRLTGSAWTKKGFPIYTTGDGIFTNKSSKWEEIKLSVNYTTSKIRGNGLNDIFLCGALGLIAHYNGNEWKVYNDVYNAVYTSVHLNGNIAAFVGWRDGKGVITIGRRN